MRGLGIGLLFTIGLVAGLTLPSGAVAGACGCVSLPSPLAALEAATDVFDGTVAGVEWVDPELHSGAQRIDLVVHTQWKGVGSGRVTVETAGDSTRGGYGFRIGRRYIVYTEGAAEAPRVSDCSRTRPWDNLEPGALGLDRPPREAVPWERWSARPASGPCPTCVTPPPPAQRRDASAAVFHGRVVGLEYLGPEVGYLRRVRYQNLGWWKGPGGRFVDVFEQAEVWTCAPENWPALEDSDASGHILYIGSDGHRLVLGICNRRRPWSAEEAAALGPMNAPQPDWTTPTPPPNPSSSPVATATPLPPSATPMACPTLECLECPGPRPAREWLTEADAVFQGRVIEIERIGCGHILHFQLNELWKGPEQEHVTVWVDGDAWQCGHRFARNKTAVVFARYSEGGIYYLPRCFGIVEGDAREALGPGRPVGIPTATWRPPVCVRLFLPSLENP